MSFHCTCAVFDEAEPWPAHDESSSPPAKTLDGDAACDDRANVTPAAAENAHDRLDTSALGTIQPPPSPDEFANLLASATGTRDPAAWNKLLEMIYGELRRLAGHVMRNEAPGQTLQPTALVNEAFIKLMNQQQGSWGDKRHFFNAAAQAMRRIMIDRARRYRREKHGGGARRVDLDVDGGGVFSELQIPALSDFTLDQAERLDNELTMMEREQPRWAEVVRLRCFAGLTMEQTAQAMALSERTVRGDYRFAKAWLTARIKAHDAAI